MAIRRMISKEILDDGFFITMKPQSKLLYTYLTLSADDDGIVDDCQMAMIKANAKAANLKELEDKKFILKLKRGKDYLIVIKHWLIANNISDVRHKKTNYPDVLEKIFVEPNLSYTLKRKERVVTLQEWLYSKHLKSRHTGCSKM